jgi:hypothetical protein
MTCMVCPVVSMSFSGLHSVIDMFTNGKCVGGLIYLKSLFWRILKFVWMILVKYCVCLV